jgi:hypothetical protein
LDGSKYFEIKDVKIDSAGQRHARLFAKCERCGESCHVANVLLPTQKLQPDIEGKFNQIHTILREVQEHMREMEGIRNRLVAQEGKMRDL